MPSVAQRVFVDSVAGYYVWRRSYQGGRDVHVEIIIRQAVEALSQERMDR